MLNYFIEKCAVFLSLLRWRFLDYLFMNISWSSLRCCSLVSFSFCRRSSSAFFSCCRCCSYVTYPCCRRCSTASVSCSSTSWINCNCNFFHLFQICRSRIWLQLSYSSHSFYFSTPNVTFLMWVLLKKVEKYFFTTMNKQHKLHFRNNLEFYFNIFEILCERIMPKLCGSNIFG